MSSGRAKSVGTDQQGTSTFYIGTCSSQLENELHELQYDSASNTLTLLHVYLHTHPIHHISAATHNNDIVATSYYNNAARQHQCTVWQLQPSPSSTATAQLHPAFNVHNVTGSTITALCFNAYNEQLPELLVCEQSTGIHLYRFTDPQCTTLQRSNGHTIIANVDTHHYTACAFSPHDDNTIAAAYTDNTIKICNTVQCTVLQVIPLHTIAATRIHSIDYNPNKPHMLVCGGTDRLLHLLDTRIGTVCTLSVHTHWVWQCRFNRVYDQLLLSCGSEMCNLWAIPTLSSAAMMESEKSSAADSTDRLVQSYTTDHTESIYGIEWSATDAFVFASLSYDGRMVVHTIPSNEKYKLLL